MRVADTLKIVGGSVVVYVVMAACSAASNPGAPGTSSSSSSSSGGGVRDGSGSGGDGPTLLDALTDPVGMASA
jgi:hypothetical protein